MISPSHSPPQLPTKMNTRYDDEMTLDQPQEAKRRKFDGTNSSVSVEEAAMNPLPGSAVHPNCPESIEDILNGNNISRYDFVGNVATPEHEKIQSNKEVMMAAFKRCDYELEFGDDLLLKNDKDIVMAAVKRNGYALGYASDDLKNDKEIVMAAVKKYGDALFYASDELKNDKDIVMAAVKKYGYALEYASDDLKNDKDFVMATVKQYGRALQFASDEVKGNREIVLAAVKKDPVSIQHAGYERNEDGSHKCDKDGNYINLSQDPEVLAAAGLFDTEDVTKEYDRRVVMSVRFSQRVGTPIEPILATLEMKKRTFFHKSFIHFPNGFDKGSLFCEDGCDGTHETCQAGDNHEDKMKNCWKYSFNNQLQQCHMRYGPHPGYMVQIINPLRNEKTYKVEEWLGEGQKEELLMAKNNGVKVFQIHDERSGWNTYERSIGRLVEAIKVWDEGGCNDSKVVLITIADYGEKYTVELLDFDELLVSQDINQQG